MARAAVQVKAAANVAIAARLEQGQHRGAAYLQAHRSIKGDLPDASGGGIPVVSFVQSPDAMNRLVPEGGVEPPHPYG